MKDIITQIIVGVVGGIVGGAFFLACIYAIIKMLSVVSGNAS